MSRRDRLRLLVSIWLVLVVHWNPLHDGSPRYYSLTRALAERGTTHLDAVSPSTHDDMFEKDGHLYCNNNPGVALLGVPAWAVVYRVYARLPAESRWRRSVIHEALAHFVAFATTTALAVALPALLVGLWVEKRSGDVPRGVAAALLYAFGTIAFHFGTHLQQNVVVAGLGFLAWTLLVAPDVLGRERSPLLAGFTLGVSTLVDLSTLPLAVVIGIELLRSEKPARTIARFALGIAPPLIALMAYQGIAFGDPIRPPQSHYAADGRQGVTTHIIPSLPNFLDVTLRPSHGFFWFMPFVWIPIIARLRGHRFETRGLVAPLVAVSVYVLFMEGTKFSQFGPRYFLPAIPFTAVRAALAWRREDAWYAVPLGVASFYINTAGAQLGVGSPSVFTTCGLYAIRGPWLPVLNWIGSDEFRAAYGTLPRIVTPWGLFLLLGVALAAIWLPAWLERPRAGQALAPPPGA